MAVALTEEEFSKHIKTIFHLNNEGQVIDLELDEVKPYTLTPEDREGMERFSIYFNGPGDKKLPQQTYHMEHDAMGEFDIFLVPIGQTDSSYRYEAVFNYFK